MTDLAAPNVNSRCPKCGAEFHCGVATGEKICWCMGLSVFSPESTSSADQGLCYCPQCLKDLLSLAAT